MSDHLNDIPEVAKRLLTGLRTQKHHAYRLAWKGSKIPRGAKLDGSPISWTQHGCVYTEQAGTIVGYYVRTKEWDGENHDEHEMIISTDGTVEAGVNQTAELIRDFPIQATEF